MAKKYIDADRVKNGVMRHLNRLGDIVCMYLADFNALLEESAVDVKEVRWIPCTERLPEKQGTYLVTGPARWRQDLMIVAVETYIGKPEVGAVWTPVEVAYVLAWMPLPEPWRAEDERV